MPLRRPAVQLRMALPSTVTPAARMREWVPTCGPGVHQPRNPSMPAGGGAAQEHHKLNLHRNFVLLPPPGRLPAGVCAGK